MRGNPAVDMDQWTGKIALVTGASAGIGWAIADRLAAEGMQVVAVARRVQRLKELAAQSKGKIHPISCDVTKEEEVLNLFKTVEEQVGPVHVLVNNAGTAYNTPVAEFETDKWRYMFELNVIAVGVATREALKLMHKHNIDDGYIINISSISSHGIPEGVGKHVYNGSKHALRVITEGLRQELAQKKSKIKVSTICPGVVETEIFEVGGWTEVYDISKLVCLPASEIAQAAVDLLKSSPNTHVADIVVRPLGETVMA